MNAEEKPHEASLSLVLSEEEIKKARTKFGDIYATNVRTDEGKVSLLFRYPGEADFRFVVNEQSKDFIGKISDSENQGDRYSAQKRVLQDCCLHPGKPDLDKLFERYPGLVLKLWSKLEKAVTPELEDIKNA